jgi:hypothetical protein
MYIHVAKKRNYFHFIRKNLYPASDHISRMDGISHSEDTLHDN